MSKHYIPGFGHYNGRLPYNDRGTSLLAAAIDEAGPDGRELEYFDEHGMYDVITDTCNRSPIPLETRLRKVEEPPSCDVAISTTACRHKF